jgi:hypothetical protein
MALSRSSAYSLLPAVSMADSLTNAVSELLHPSRDLVAFASKGLLRNKRVLLRLDLNLPVDETTGVLTDLTRLVAALPTIHLLIDNGAKVRTDRMHQGCALS